MAKVRKLEKFDKRSTYHSLPPKPPYVRSRSGSSGPSLTRRPLPLKHGYVNAPMDWVYSSFRWYVRAGKYPADWGAGRVITFPPEIGRE